MPIYRTLGELRAVIQTRLGFGASGAGAGVNAPIIDDFLLNAQAQLYWAGLYNSLKQRTGGVTPDVIIGAQQTLVDYPADANPQRIDKIATKYSGRWRDLVRGIRTEDYDFSIPAGFPRRYEFYGEQVEIWPAADIAYPLRFWYAKKLGRFTIDTDRATVDDDMIFLHALANAKAHYRQPDAEFYSQQLTTLLTSIRAHNLGSMPFRRDQYMQYEHDPYRYPPEATSI